MFANFHLIRLPGVVAEQLAVDEAQVHAEHVRRLHVQNLARRAEIALRPEPLELSRIHAHAVRRKALV